MAQFYAEIQGHRGLASRLGTKASGMSSSTKSWAGEVNVVMSTGNGLTDNDYVRIVVCRHGGGQGVVVYDGPVTQMREVCAMMVAAYQELGPLGVLAVTEHYKRDHERRAA